MSKDKEMNEELEENVNTNQTEENSESTEEAKKEMTPEEKVADLNDKYLRLYSDFDNFRKRTMKEKADLISSASGGVIKDMLVIVDDFERAIDNNEKTDDVDGLKEGFKLIYNKLNHILKSKGLEAVDVVGEAFDPEIHEAITNIPAPTEADKGKIIDCVEKGYNLNGKPLRYPKVVVGQ